MPLGSLSTLGLAGPNGTPLTDELPAPADPAGGVSCAQAPASGTKLPISSIKASAELRDIEYFRACKLQQIAPQVRQRWLPDRACGPRRANR